MSVNRVWWHGTSEMREQWSQNDVDVAVPHRRAEALGDRVIVACGCQVLRARRGGNVPDFADVVVVDGDAEAMQRTQRSRDG